MLSSPAQSQRYFLSTTAKKIKQIFVISHEARENVRVINKHVDHLPKQQNKLSRFKYILKISLN